MTKILIGIFIVFCMLLIVFIQKNTIETSRTLTHSLNNINKVIIAMNDDDFTEINGSVVKDILINTFNEIQILKDKEKIEELSHFYIKFLNKIDRLEIKSKKYLSIRLGIENEVVKSIDYDNNHNLFTLKIKIYLRNELENVLIMTKEPLLEAIENTQLYAKKISGDSLIESNTSQKMMKLLKYKDEHFYPILEKHIVMEVNAVRSGDFEKLNAYIKKQEKIYLSRKADKYKILKEEYPNATVLELGMKKIAEELSHTLLKYNEIEDMYSRYMKHIEKNKKLLDRLGEF